MDKLKQGNAGDGSLLLSNPTFLKLIETARKEIRAGKTTSLEELEKKIRAERSRKLVPRARKSRR